MEGHEVKGLSAREKQLQKFSDAEGRERGEEECYSWEQNYPGGSKLCPFPRPSCMGFLHEHRPGHRAGLQVPPVRLRLSFHDLGRETLSLHI